MVQRLCLLIGRPEAAGYQNGDRLRCPVRQNGPCCASPSGCLRPLDADLVSTISLKRSTAHPTRHSGDYTRIDNGLQGTSALLDRVVTENAVRKQSCHHFSKENRLPGELEMSRSTSEVAVCSRVMRRQAGKLHAPAESGHPAAEQLAESAPIARQYRRLIGEFVVSWRTPAQN
jgi:hypothetical protein